MSETYELAFPPMMAAMMGLAAVFAGFGFVSLFFAVFGYGVGIYVAREVIEVEDHV